MKRIIFLATAITALVACNKSESLNVSIPEEINFQSMVQNETRGYVIGNTFEQISRPDVYTGSASYNSSIEYHADSNTSRTMVVSAYNVSDNQDYFLGKDFRKGSNNIWHNWNNGESPLYWPIGKNLEFLAYSTSKTYKDYVVKDSLKGTWNGAKEVSFKITKKEYQNDIMYAQASGNNRGTINTSSSNSSSGLSIQFFHAQAWLTFIVQINSSNTDDGGEIYQQNIISVDDIVMKDVYNSGVLTIKYDDKNASLAAASRQPIAEWDFFTQTTSDVSVDDPWDVLKSSNLYKNSTTGANGVRLDMLMPAQPHNDFVLYYTLNNKKNSVVLPFYKGTSSYQNSGFSTSDAKKWEMGKHYTYNITLEINEITFNPTVKTWVEIKGFNSDQTL